MAKRNHYSSVSAALMVVPFMTLAAVSAAGLPAKQASTIVAIASHDLYVTNGGNGNQNGAGGLSAYSLRNGKPTALSGAASATGSAGGPWDVAISPDGKYLYVTNERSRDGTGGLSAYSLANGEPTALPGSPYATGSAGAPSGLAISPDGKYLYVANRGSGNGVGGLSVYSISNGVPAPLSGSPFATGSAGGPWNVAISPDGKYLYVTNDGSGNGVGGLSAYSLSDGVPTPLPGSPYATGTVGGPLDVAISPDGQYLYVTNDGNGNLKGAGGLSVYWLQDGVPIEFSNSAYATGPRGSPLDMAISPDGRYLYVTNNGSSNGFGGLSAYSLQNGVPNALAGSPYATGAAGGPWNVAISADGKYLYVTNGGSINGAGGLSVYSLQNGVPTALSGSPFATGSIGGPWGVAVSP